MAAEDEHGRRKDGGGGDLVRPRRLLAALAEHDRRVIGGAGEEPGERQRRVVARPFRGLPVLEAVDGLPRELVRPGARFAGRFVRAVEVDHDVPFRRLAQDRLIPVDHFLALVIEEVDLGADDAERAAFVEKCPLLLNGGQGAAVFHSQMPMWRCAASSMKSRICSSVHRCHKPSTT
jgi:hypothetical protein